MIEISKNILTIKMIFSLLTNLQICLNEGFCCYFMHSVVTPSFVYHVGPCPDLEIVVAEYGARSTA
jgi:hypothetical protein